MIKGKEKVSSGTPESPEVVSDEDATVVATTPVRNGGNPARRWCITDNTRPADYDVTKWSDNFNSNVKYAVWQKEKASTGKVHIQAFIKLDKPQRLASIKKMLGLVHAEPARGSDKQCIDYCSKKDSRLEGPCQFGELDKQGTRKDLEEVSSMVLKNNMSPDDVAMERGDVFIRYHHGIHALYEALQRKTAQKFRRVEVIVLWGGTGTGKTRSAYNADPMLYRPNYGNTGVWWNGYFGQKTLLLDDFYGQLKASALLRVLDGYPEPLDSKHGMSLAKYTTVYITSNVDPSKWYPNVPEDVRLALNRRITRVQHVVADSGASTSKSVEDEDITCAQDVYAACPSSPMRGFFERNGDPFDEPDL